MIRRCTSEEAHWLSRCFKRLAAAGNYPASIGCGALEAFWAEFRCFRAGRGGGNIMQMVRAGTFQIVGHEDVCEVERKVESDGGGPVMSRG